MLEDKLHGDFMSTGVQPNDYGESLADKTRVFSFDEAMDQKVRAWMMNLC